MRIAGALLLLACAAATLACARDATKTADAGGATGAASATANPDDDAPPALRLPRDVTPREARIDLEVDPEKLSIEGRAELELTLARPRRMVWLHAAELELIEAKLRGDDAALTTTITAAGFLGVRLPRAIAGPITLAFHYRAHIRDGDDRGAFAEDDGGRRYVYTQFENTDARSVMPCLDEPGFKAPWTLTLRVPAELVALSNTPVADESVESGKRIVRFEKTPPLPSYLVAFGVGPFESVEAGRWGRNQTPVRIVVPRGHREAAAYAAEKTGPLLVRLEDRFDLAHPYPKLDVLVVPQAVSFAAMEHPGLITVVAGWSLVPLGDPAVRTRRRYVDVMAHELAHQWAGNLVTTAWWDDIWLNEAFAEWAGAEIAAEEAPEQGFELALLDLVDTALELDGLKSARAIRQPILAADDIENAFDPITYEKGAAVLQMFARRVGPERFRRAVHTYFQRHAHGVATAADLFAVIDEIAGENVSTAMATFVDRSGVPRVHLDPRCGRIGVRVDRHLAGGGEPMEPPWGLPLCLRWGTTTGTAAHERCTTVTSSSATIAIDGCPTWLAPQARGVGYYRAVLPPPVLTASLDPASGLDVRERIRLARDLLPLADAGALPYDAALAVLPALSKHDNAQVRREALRVYADALQLDLTPGTRARLRHTVTTALGPEARALGLSWRPQESVQTTLWRSDLVGLMATDGGDAQLARQADQLFDAWISAHGKQPELPTDTRYLVLRIVAHRSDPRRLDQLIARLHSEANPRERGALVQALTRVHEPAQAARISALFLDESLDPRLTIGLLAGQPETVGARIGVFERELDRLLARVPSEAGLAILDVMSDACTPADRARVAALIDRFASKVTGGPRTAAATLESIDQCIRRRARFTAALEAWAAEPR